MKQQQASLRGDRHAHFIRNHQSFAALELFAGDEPLDVQFQFASVRFIERAIKANHSMKNSFPISREFRSDQDF
jgi:hypothetical protein